MISPINILTFLYFVMLLPQAPGVFVFGELLDMANIQDLENSPNAKYLNLLNLFAYGRNCYIYRSLGAFYFNFSFGNI